jgi:hypothetical protein
MITPNNSIDPHTDFNQIHIMVITFTINHGMTILAQKECVDFKLEQRECTRTNKMHVKICIGMKTVIIEVA